MRTRHSIYSILGASALALAVASGCGDDGGSTADAATSNSDAAAQVDAAAQIDATPPADGMVDGMNDAMNPTLTVTAPNGGETWLYLTNQDITWTSTGSVGNVNIDLLQDGIVVQSLATDVANTGTFMVAVTDAIAASATNTVRVQAVADALVTDDSDAVFAIGPEVPLITDISPPGELPGTTAVITGTGFTVGMTIDFGGVPVVLANFVDGDVGANADSFEVVLPDLLAASVDVMVTVDMVTSATFPYTMGPTVISVDTTGAIPGDTVTIMGTGFREGIDIPITGNFVDFTVRAAAAPAEFVVQDPMTSTNIGAGDDTVANVVTTFAGNSIWPAGNIAIDSNGNVRTPGSNGGSDFTNDPLPTAGNAGPMLLAPLWDDWAPQLGGSVVFSEETVDGAAGTLVITWNNTPQFNGAPDGYTFQLQIFATPPASATANVVARFVYVDLVNGAPNDNGASATIGYQANQTATGADTFSLNAASIVDGDVIDLIAAVDSPFTVNFGGTIVTGTVAVGSTEMATAVVPAIAAGATDISVINPDGRVSANSVSFDVGAPAP